MKEKTGIKSVDNGSVETINSSGFDSLKFLGFCAVAIFTALSASMWIEIVSESVGGLFVLGTVGSALCKIFALLCAYFAWFEIDSLRGRRKYAAERAIWNRGEKQRADTEAAIRATAEFLEK